MSLLRTIRYKYQRRASFVRCAMLLVLISVTVAGMPRWMVHAHTAGDEAALVVAMDGHGLQVHDVAADDLADPLMGDVQLHGHCLLGAFSTLLPSVLMSVPCSAPHVDRGPSGLAPPLCEGHLATLHRPPIV